MFYIKNRRMISHCTKMVAYKVCIKPSSQVNVFKSIRKKFFLNVTRGIEFSLIVVK